MRIHSRGDILEKKNFDHMLLGTYYPHAKRLERIGHPAEGPAARVWQLKVDAVIVFYHPMRRRHCSTPTRSRWRRWRTGVSECALHLCRLGFMGPKYAKNNEESFAFE